MNWKMDGEKGIWCEKDVKQLLMPENQWTDLYEKTRNPEHYTDDCMCMFIPPDHHLQDNG